MQLVERFRSWFESLVARRTEDETQRAFDRFVQSDAFADIAARARVTRMGDTLGDVEAVEIAAVRADEVMRRVEAMFDEHFERRMQTLVERMIEEYFDGRKLYTADGTELQLSILRKRPQGGVISDANLGQLRLRFRKVIRDRAKELAAIVPRDIAERLCKGSRFAFGWTEWKLNADRTTAGAQILVAIGPKGCGPWTGGRVITLPDGSQYFPRFYQINVHPDAVPISYEVGEFGRSDGMLTYDEAQTLLRATDDEIYAFYEKPFRKLVELVTEVER